MFVAALAHAYAFPPKDYMDPAHPTKGFLANVHHMFDLRDVVHDVGDVVESHVDTATEAVKETTHAVLVVAPKAAVKGLAKAAAAPESLLNYLTSDGVKNRSSKRRRQLTSRPGEANSPAAASDDSDDEAERKALLNDQGETHLAHPVVTHVTHFGNLSRVASYEHELTEPSSSRSSGALQQECSNQAGAPPPRRLPSQLHLPPEVRGSSADKERMPLLGPSRFA
ncbi:hypothetical protein V8C86DRAFT_1358246 [Haematococcus lacustris]